MLKLFILSCLATAVLGQFNVKFNQLLDGQLEMVNGALAHANLHNVNMGDKTVNGADIKGMTIGDVATLQRIGDAVMKTLDDSTLQVSSTIGLKDMIYHIDSYTSSKISFQNATYVIKTNSLDWVYTIAFTSTGGCSLSVQDLQINFDDVTMYSNDPKMNGIDVSKAFEQVTQYINNFFKSAQFQTIMSQHDPCKGSTSAWSKFFSMLV